MSRYFSQTELDAIINQGAAPVMAPEVDGAAKPAEPRESEWFSVEDTLMAVPRGAVGFGKSIYNLADTIGMDVLPDWDTNPLGTSKTHVGSVIENLTQFAAGFVPGLGIAGWAGKAMQAGKLGATVANIASKAGAVGKFAAAGAISDFASFEANSGRLSDILVQSDSPWLNNTVTQYLKTDMEDGELEGRLKSAFEGLIAGAALDGTVGLVKGSLKAMRSAERKIASGIDPDLAMKQAAEEVRPEIEAAAKLMEDMPSPPSISSGSFRASPNMGVEAGEGQASRFSVGGVMSPAAVTEIRAALAGGARDQQALESVVNDLKDRNLINLSGMLKDSKGNPRQLSEIHADIIAIAKTVTDNPEKFAKGAVVGNTANQQKGLAALMEVADTGGANAAELLRAAKEGGVLAQQLNEAMPFILAVDAAAKRSLMNGLATGDKAATVQAFAMIVAQGRQTKGFIGRALQMTQAFNSYKDIEKWIGKLPADRLKELREQQSEVLAMLVADPTTGKMLAQRFTQGGILGTVPELFRNSILSGPKTLSVNIAGNASAMILPLERAAGKVMAGFGRGGARAGSIKNELSVFHGFLQSTKEAYNAFKVSLLKEEGDSFVLGRGNTQYGEFSPTRTISSKNARLMGDIGKVGIRGKTADTIIDAVGKVVNIPSRLLGSTDEFSMTITARANAGTALREAVAEELKLPLSHPKVLAETDRLLDKMFIDGQLYTRQVIAERAGREARAKGIAYEDPKFIPFVQRYIDQNWDQHSSEAFMEAGLPRTSMQMFSREDAKIMQKASAEIERRVKTSTWKRDYDEIIENGGFFASLIGNLGKGTSSMIGHVPVLQMVVPFVKTPTNLFAFVAERLPPDAIQGLWKAAKAGDRKAIEEAAGRLATGTVFLVTAAGLASSGMLTGRGPQDPALRKQLLDSGWQPYSMKIGGKFVSYGRLDPFASFLGVIADAHDYLRDTYEPTPEEQDWVTKSIAAGLYSFSNNFTNKSYLKGLVTTLDALMGDEAAQNRLMRTYAGALVPNALAQSDIMANSDIETPRTPGEAVMARIPFVNKASDKFRNALGEPVSTAESPWSVFLPTTITQASKDPLRRELADNLISIGSPSRTLPGGVDLKKFENEKGQSAYDRYQELVGSVTIGGQSAKQRLLGLVRSPFYSGLPALGQDGVDSPRQSFVRGQVSLYRRSAMRQLLREFPELAQAVAQAQRTKASLIRG